MLLYSDPDSKRNLIEKALGLGLKKRIISDFRGIIFGGSTSTFTRHKAALMAKLED